MKRKIGQRNDGRASFMFEVQNKTTGENEKVAKTGISRLDAFQVLKSEIGNSFTIKWA